MSLNRVLIGFTPRREAPMSRLNFMGEISLEYEINGVRYVFTTSHDFFISSQAKLVNKLWEDISSKPEMYKNGSPAFNASYSSDIISGGEFVTSIFGVPSTVPLTYPLNNLTTLTIFNPKDSAIPFEFEYLANGYIPSTGSRNTNMWSNFLNLNHFTHFTITSYAFFEG